MIFTNIQKEQKQQIKILIYCEPVKVYNQQTQTEIIKEFHNSIHGGHLGVRKTTLKLKQRFIWKNMNKMVKKYILNCPQCKLNKLTKHTREKLILTNTPGTSFETVSLDTVGPLRIADKYRYILTIQCDLTKYIVACPMETKDAKTVATTLVNKFILVYGTFKILKSDKGTEFTNQLLSEICKLLEIKQTFSTPYHHETLGSIERNHRVLNEFLLNYSKDNDWHTWIPFFAFAYNTTPHVETGYSPYELVFGKLPYLPNDEVKNNAPIYNEEDYVKELKHRLNYSLSKAKDFLEKSKIKRTSLQGNTNPLNLEIGDKVLLKVMNRRKNQPPYQGPYTIIKRNGVNSSISIDGKLKEYHNNMLKKWNII